jgi:hypothetical protein
MSASTDLVASTALTPPVPGGQPGVTPPVPADAGGGRRASTGPAAPAARPTDDPDDAFLRSAEEGVRAWEAGTGTAPAVALSRPASTPAPQAPANRQDPQATVPAAVVGRLRGELRQASQMIHELRAEVAAAKAQPAQTQQPNPQAQPEPEYAAIQAACQAEMLGVRTRMLDLAKKYDAGEIESMEKYEDQRTALLAEMFVLQGTDIVAYLKSVMPKAPPVALSDRVLLDRQIAELEANHPWVQYLSDKQMDLLDRYAVEEMQAQGLDTTPGPMTVYEIRRRVAEASDYYGPRWHPNLVAQVEAARQTRPTNTPAATAATPPAPMPRARTAPQPPAQPPNPSTMGATALPRGTGPTEQDMMNMDFEDLGRLPQRSQAA